jgi:hypothetical protein
MKRTVFSLLLACGLLSTFVSAQQDEQSKFIVEVNKKTTALDKARKAFVSDVSTDVPSVKR